MLLLRIIYIANTISIYKSPVWFLFMQLYKVEDVTANTDQCMQFLAYS